MGLTGRCQLNEVPEEGREAVTVDGSFLDGGDQGEGQAWHVLAKQGAGGGRLGRGGQTEARGSGAVRAGLDALGLREVRAGRGGPYAAGHLTDLWDGGPGGFAAFPAWGLAGGNQGWASWAPAPRGKPASRIFHVVGRSRFPGPVGLGSCPPPPTTAVSWGPLASPCSPSLHLGARKGMTNASASWGLSVSLSAARSSASCRRKFSVVKGSWE